MKKYLPALFLCVLFFSAGFMHSCKKSVIANPPTPDDSVITTSFTEEFKDFAALIMNTGWLTKDIADTIGIASSTWGQGNYGTDKSGNPVGLTAYSYSSSKDEYAYSLDDGFSTSISSWLITPVLSVKNGDAISFYACGDPGGGFTDRMQVLMSNSESSDIGDSLNSVGSFTTILIDINPGQAVNGFPTTWTRYSYTFSGITGHLKTRIAFRHYDVNPVNAGGIGIDRFNFQVN